LSQFDPGPTGVEVLGMIGSTGWNGYFAAFGSPSWYGGLPTILNGAYFVLGNVLGAGSGLTPVITGLLGTISLLNSAEKLNRLCWAVIAGDGAITWLVSIGLNAIADGGGPPRIVLGDEIPVCARADPATQAAQRTTATQPSMRMLSSSPPREGANPERTMCEGGEDSVRARRVKANL
jgi:hypothetical protein